MTYVIGLTGGIGSGKTTVSDLFAEQGVDVVDADIIARQVVEPGTEGLNKIADKFGSGMLTDEGTLNRSALREHIFSHPEDKEWLNQLLHPIIRQKMKDDCQQATSPYCLLVVPLLVENNLISLIDRLLVVDVSEETQIKRTVQRDGVSRQQVENILASQASRDARKKAADDLITNEDNSDTLKEQVVVLHNKYLTLATQEDGQ
ncbi:dephospho-CoA kinase [Veronia nyctiphanis]|uniref:Dephospho-CoA kinase n=1 Tax=Veronia nyctiphanis TaxID=1278244 RepID=A0A4Q0YTY1_9GAMM|nr:dephospho-CoA kinase [Veronia nyctiphanis]RXJ72471.1 dephospho-CoA kinase [Veronia nyctiphanis]